MAILNYAPPKPGTVTDKKEKEPKVQEKGTGMVNYCRTGDGMSTCGVTGKKWCNHVDCKFARKSDRSDRCMHLTFDEFCWNTKAQDSANALKGTRYNITS